jgi:hypothetical protein
MKQDSSFECKVSACSSADVLAPSGLYKFNHGTSNKSLMQICHLCLYRCRTHSLQKSLKGSARFVTAAEFALTGRAGSMEYSQGQSSSGVPMSPSRGGNQHKCDQVMFECMQKVAEIIVHSRLALPRPHGGRKSRVRVSALYTNDCTLYSDPSINFSRTVPVSAHAISTVFRGSVLSTLNIV